MNSTWSVVLSAMVGILWLNFPAYATTGNGPSDGEHGVVYVRGTLTESACRLEMASTSQTVDMGTINTGQLQRDGQGTPVALHLQLRDCLHTSSASRDPWLSNRIWNPSQPSVALSFLGVTASDAPTLLKVNGAEGFALRISDEQGQDVRIGSWGRPLQLTPGDNGLTWYITPQRTSQPLRVGSFSAQMNFWLNYD